MSQLLTRVSEHVYWMPPGPPDRPSLCAVVSGSECLMLDAGASAAHAAAFLQALAEAGVPEPRFVALTHWHWDHVFGAAAIGAPVIAHVATMERLDALSRYAWDDASLQYMVDRGEINQSSADNIRLELPAPRQVEIVQPSIVFQGTVQIRVGDVICSIMHVGGDHSPDSCVMYVAPDAVVFLGDCLYDAIYTPVRHYTTRRLMALLDSLMLLDGEYWIEGHTAEIMSWQDFQALAIKMQVAGGLVERFGIDERAIHASDSAQRYAADADFADVLRGLIAGRSLEYFPPDL